MAIVAAKDKKGNTIHDKNGDIIYKYNAPEWEVLYDKLAELLDSFSLFVQEQDGLSLADIMVDKVLLTELLIRIDKRKDYFIIFHDTTYINEIKEAGLTAYWLTKMKPFRVKDANGDLHKKYRHVNEAFAVFVLYSIIKEEASRKENMNFSISKEYNKKIMYAFKFWDLSKESLMLIAESLCESMCD